MVDRSINPDEHQTRTTTSTTPRPPIDWLIMTLRVVQNPDDRQVNDPSSHPSSSSNTADSQPENLVDDKNHNPSASHFDAAQTKKGKNTKKRKKMTNNEKQQAQTSQGGSSSRRAVDQVIERNENSEGRQQLGRFKLPKSTASKLIQGGGVAQNISGNINKGKDQSIGCFDIYNDNDNDNDDDDSDDG